MVWAACLVGILLTEGGLYAKPKKDAEWLVELNRMEGQAVDARKAYWSGRYEEAQQQFTALTASVHPSVILYVNECAMCSLAQGRYVEAERHLRRVDSLLNTYYSEEREKLAVSAFGAEAEKVYRGDPYEQATAYMLLALVLLDRGDYDNALAACKSGILADSDASEDLFDSDIALLHALEAKCCQLRGEEEAFRAHREAAAKSVGLTCAQVRDDFSKRQDLLALLKMSRAERRRIGETRPDEEIQEELQRMSDELDRRIEAIDAANQLGPLYSGQFNVLIVVPRGRSVQKMRTGGEAEMIVFSEHRAQCQPPDLRLDGEPLRCEVSAAALDVDFQAMTRGGRRMDAILKGKAVSRANTREVGQAFVEAGNNAGGVAGLGVVLIGGIMQATAGAMTAEADTRCWQTLPKRFDVYALKLPAGTHELAGFHHLYFQKCGEFRRTFSLEYDADMAVVFVPPPTYGSYFRRSEMKLSDRDRDPSGADVFLVPPPMDLDDVVRIDVVDAKEKPEAIAPDPRRVMRAIRGALSADALANVLVSHDEIVASRASLAEQHRCALQCRFAGMVKEGTQKSGAYRIRLLFSVVETASGRVLLSKTMEGTSTNTAGGPSTAFYEGVKSATEALIRDPEFARVRSL
jgi:tetratricopeptide (TPR) repeat protein